MPSEVDQILTSMSNAQIARLVEAIEAGRVYPGSYWYGDCGCIYGYAVYEPYQEYTADKAEDLRIQVTGCTDLSPLELELARTALLGDTHLTNELLAFVRESAIWKLENRGL